ncbi:MAG TPA: response regulator [Acidimicrobiales bacterium]|nr:response regulator [Acidimicrobiales bacterium]
MGDRQESDDVRRYGTLRFRPGAMPPLFGDTTSVLVVDDDATVGRLLAAILAPEGYRCTIVSNAQEARDALARQPFALALVDVMMPGENGLELVADIIPKYPDTAVVMVTGVDEPSIADLALDSGAFDFVLKPIRDSELLITVANAGRRRCLEIDRRAKAAKAERELGDTSAALGDALDRLNRASPDEGRS